MTTMSDPAAVQGMLDKIDEIQNEAAPVDYDPETRLPQDGEVTLCAGLLTPEGVVDTAYVRELNGRDEEAIARLSSPGKQLLTILSRGVERLGNAAPSEDELEMLLAADRDLLLLEIRKVTFGDIIELPFMCPECMSIDDDPIDYKYDLNDIPVEYLKDKVGDRVFTVKLRIGEARCSLPNGVVQKELYLSNNKSSSEMNTMMLFNCVRSINGNDVLMRETILELGMADRDTLIKEIGKRIPGPQWADIKLACLDCGEEVPYPLTADSLFRV